MKLPTPVRKLIERKQKAAANAAVLARAYGPLSGHAQESATSVVYQLIAQRNYAEAREAMGVNDGQ